LKTDDRIRAEAAAWVDWSSGPKVEPAETAAFERWMGESAQHRDAFADLVALWRSDALAEAAAEVGRARSARRRPWTMPWNILVPAGMAVAVAAAIGVIAPLGELRTIETARGETRTVVLADGSTVRMNGAARLKVSQSLVNRTVALEQGEAYFDIRHDGRPFSVTTVEGEVRVLGTAFNVDRLASGRTEVSVYRGAVAFGSKRQKPLSLRPGDQAAIEHGRLMRIAAAAHPQPDWFDGWFDAEDASLAQLAEEMDRFSTRPIVVDAAAGRIRVSGRFEVSRPEAVLELIRVAYGVDVVQREDRILISGHGSR
jgi:transmembrane sensor